MELLPCHLCALRIDVFYIDRRTIKNTSIRSDKINFPFSEGKFIFYEKNANK